MPQRTSSLSSDVLSASGYSVAGYSASGLSLAGTLPVAQPSPAYIAAGGASQLITAEVGESVAVSQSALALVNNFLDQILFDLLATSHSTALPQLRSAVPLVLKPRLGKAALKVADDELHEYLEDSDDEDQPSIPIARKDFDLDLAWKLARLRCMVYTRLGDLEEEDEEEILEQEGLSQPLGAASRAMQLGPASAIFLTSVLEYIGEQALYYAAQHAQKRFSSARTIERGGITQDSYPNDTFQLVVEDADMSQIGRESPLSRLWRSWRRTARYPKESFSRPLSPETLVSPTEASPKGIGKSGIGIPVDTIAEEHQSLKESPGEKSPSQIPLPMSDRDVDEIEVPGLAREIREVDEVEPVIPVPERNRRRPTSMMIPPLDTTMPLTPASTDESPQFQERSPRRLHYKHTRSYSLPTPAQTPFTIPKDAEQEQTEPAAEPDLDNHSQDESDPESQASVTQAPESTTQAVLNEGKVPEDEILQNSDSSVTHARPDTTTKTLDDEDEQQVGRLAAAVSAVAGVLGLGAASTYIKSTSKPSESADAEDKVKPPKSIAEQMLQPSSDVPPPRDAVTGASITSVGDFDGIHMPTQDSAQEETPPASPEVSDPEDLALSSEDEGPPSSEHQDQAASKQDKNPTHVQQDPVQSRTTVLSDSDVEEDDQQPKSIESSPSTRKPPADYAAKTLHRQGVVYEGSQVPDVEEQGVQESHRDENLAKSTYVPKSHTDQSNGPSVDVSRPTTGAAEESSIQSPVSPLEETVHLFQPTSKPWTAQSAQGSTYLNSANARPGSAHAHADSKSSQHTQNSESSSSSSKLLGFDREQQARLALGASPKDTADTAEEAGSRNSASRKPNNLRLRMDAEETRKASPVDLDDEAKKKSLEMLINSDETLHYTLTPSSARAEQFPIPPMPKTQTQELADFFRTKPPSEESARPRTARSLVPNGLNGLRANPPTTETTPQPRKFIPSSKNITPPTSSQKMKNRLVMPRDARVEGDNTRDLADYARSTGPDNTYQLPKALAPAVSPSVGGASKNLNSKPSASRMKFQPRDATIPRHAESTELIDFIREGPPRPPGEHRIDRNVAPFRRTMDSDDLNGLVSSQERDRNGTSSVASTHDSSVAKSFQSSLNSRTALLDTSHRSNAATAGAPKSTLGGSIRQTAVTEEGSIPKRNRRRVRDPYAIDDSDEELEEAIPTPKPKTQDESLIDFLRNTAPPPNMTTQPILTANPSTTSSTVKPESGNTGLRDRLLRSSLTGLNQKGNGSGRSSREGDRPPAYNRSSNLARTESPHLTQIGSKLDSYRPTKPTHADHVERNRQKAKVAEARDPRAAGNTSDLADYLRNSGPIAPPPVPKEPFKPSKEETGFLRVFLRRKSVKG